MTRTFAAIAFGILLILGTDSDHATAQTFSASGDHETLATDDDAQSPAEPAHGASARKDQRSRPVTLIYIGAYDCAPCRDWELFTKPGFLRSPEAAKVAYRELKAGSYRDIGYDSLWPTDLRWVRDRLKLKGGTPRFILVEGDRILRAVGGTKRWSGDVVPYLKAMP